MLELAKEKKESIFCTVYLFRREFFKICVLFQCIVYWIHFQNIHTCFIHFCCLFLKSSKSFSVSLNNKINRIHKRALRLVYQNNLSFSELLHLDNSVILNQKNSQVLVTEIYKVEIWIAPEKMKDILELENASYNLKPSCHQFRRKNIKTIH